MSEEAEEAVVLVAPEGSNPLVIWPDEEGRQLLWDTLTTDPGEYQYTVRSKMMTRAEYDALPAHVGF